MNEKKLKFSEKLSYGISDFPEVVNSILTAFLTMFYTDSIGMAAGAVGTMFFLSKLFDGITMRYSLLLQIQASSHCLPGFPLFCSW